MLSQAATIAGVVLTVALVCAGQLMFKHISIIINAGAHILSVPVLGYAILAFAVSGSGSLVWIYLLRSVELNRVYPYMAMSFVILPILSAFFFGEKLSLHYFVGIAFIALGIVAITTA